MITVTTHDVGDVALYPFFEEVGRTLIARLTLVPTLQPLALGELPLVATLIHHQHTQLVTQVIHDRSLRIVAHADSISTHRLKRLYAATPYLGGHHSTQHTCIMVKAHTLDFHVYAIEGKACVGIKL